MLSRKKANYNKTGIEGLPNDKPVLYRIKTGTGMDNYVGTAKRGRVQDRLKEHLAEIPGITVEIQQFDSIAEAREKETNVINARKPKYNRQGK